MSGQLARDRDCDDGSSLAARFKRVPAGVETARAAIGLSPNGSRLAAPASFERNAHARRASLVPGCLDQEPTGVGVACLGDRSLATPLTA